MENIITAIGKIIRSNAVYQFVEMAKANMFGQMGRFMMEILSMIKNMAMAHSNSLMEGCMKGNGKMINNMGEHFSNYLMGKLHMANGKMAFVSIEILLIICKKLFPSLSP